MPSKGRLLAKVLVDSAGDISSGSLDNATITDGSITTTKLASSIQTTLSSVANKADTSSVNSALANKSDITTTVTKDSSTGAATIPVGTTAQRPATPSTGMVRHNTDVSLIETYNGSSWVAIGDQSLPYSIELLVVAGGGGGGLHSGGGGGAGGLLYYGAETAKTANGSAITVNPNTTFSVVVGAGGASSGGTYTSVPGNGYDGQNSSFGTYIAIGGGGGGSGGNGVAGRNGGSGGGGGRSIAAGSGTTGQGNAGGYPGTGGSANYPGAGGGGAGATGGNGNTGQGGNGGNGLQYSISGTATYYAGGGGGNLQDTANTRPPQGTGGLGGGGGATSTNYGDAGSANTGGGGGGANYNQPGGGTGGSGIVILRYSGAQKGTGGTVTSSGGYTIHTFTSSGTYRA